MDCISDIDWVPSAQLPLRVVIPQVFTLILVLDKLKNWLLVHEDFTVEAQAVLVLMIFVYADDFMLVWVNTNIILLQL